MFLALTLFVVQLLGLHLLGIGYTTSQAAKSAALARNSSQTSSSSIVNTALSNQNQVYRHPIVYDKLTGATNNQINDVLGSKQPASDYPLDHYQHQQQQHPNQPFNQAFNSLGQDEFFARPQLVGFPPHPLSRHMPPPMMSPPPMMTTQPPSLQQQQQLGLMPLPPLPPPAPPNGQPQQQQQRPQSFNLQNPSSAGPDSLPSASSLNNDGARPNNTIVNPQHQQPPSVYYTPPIFAYNNFDQTRPLSELQLAQYGYGLPPQQQQQQQFRRGPQQVALGVPEAPLSVDEYNARQAKLRQLNGQQQLGAAQRSGPANVEPQFSTGLGQQPQQPVNLLADPQQQQRHKQQMLDRQVLFNGAPFPHSPMNELSQNQNASIYYPDPALYKTVPNQGGNIRPPYAHNLGPPQQHQDQQFAMLKQPQLPPPSSSRIISNQNNRLLEPNKHIKPSNQQPQTLSSNLISDSSSSSIPICARQQELAAANLELANSTSQMPVLFCNEDQEYPTKDIMRALEIYAADRSIEQLLPQLLIQIHLTQRTSQPDTTGQLLTLDNLQPSLVIGNPQSKSPDQLQVAFDDGQSRPAGNGINGLFPSGNYESLCKSNVFMAQPRRAKNLLNQWKVIVNLPGHKYRGIAISQMIRVEECSRPNSECSAPGLSSGRAMPLQQPQSLLAKSRCLQHYENQRLVAWSHQQGLHLDIFRVPIACSCHIRR